jgi:hypothetical protein
MSAKPRGQGSLEFLMTYGWVLLVILIALVVLWQWGLFNIGERIEPGSFGFWGLVPQGGNEFILDSGGQLRVSFINMVGANVTVLSFNATIDKALQTSSCAGGCAVVEPGGVWTMQLTDNVNWLGEPGRRFEASISVEYNDTRTGATIYRSSGSVWGNVES